MNLIEVFKKFPTQEYCIKYLEKMKWENKPICPYCKSNKITPTKVGLRHHCNTCNTSFSITVGTIFHHTHLPLQKWFLAIIIVLNKKKNLSNRQLAHNIKVTKDTARSMQIRIRQALTETPSLLVGIVEMNEPYVELTLKKVLGV